MPARAVGAKLLKRNLSDIAAMGGRPVAAVISLALAPETSVAWLRQFYLGLATTARRFGVKIVGGDVTQGPAKFFGAFLTLHGESTGRLITRQGARLGDAIFVTGRLGGSLAGHHYRFTPRLAEGQWLARQKNVAAMMDVSDGIAKDIQALTPNGLVAAVSSASLPISTAARALARRSGRAGVDPRAHRWRGLRTALRRRPGKPIWPRSSAVGSGGSTRPCIASEVLSAARPPAT
ncbi:MAG: thiamine-phosphate kinase [Lacunisphaera sp.]